MTPVTPTDKLKFLDALKSISASMSRIEAERDLIKHEKDDLCDALQLNRKLVNKLARTYHKGNYTEEVEIQKEFEDLYQSILTKTP
jgi:hypothetical protein